jgi:hypothetical protein
MKGVLLCRSGNLLEAYHSGSFLSESHLTNCHHHQIITMRWCSLSRVGQPQKIRTFSKVKSALTLDPRLHTVWLPYINGGNKHHRAHSRCKKVRIPALSLLSACRLSESLLHRGFVSVHVLPRLPRPFLIIIV